MLKLPSTPSQNCILQIKGKTFGEAAWHRLWGPSSKAFLKLCLGRTAPSYPVLGTPLPLGTGHPWVYGIFDKTDGSEILGDDVLLPQLLQKWNEILRIHRKQTLTEGKQRHPTGMKVSSTECFGDIFQRYIHVTDFISWKSIWSLQYRSTGTKQQIMKNDRKQRNNFYY